MEDFVRKTLEVRDVKSLPLNTSKELDMVADREGRIYIKIKNVYKEMLFDDYSDVINHLLTIVGDLEDYDETVALELETIKKKLLEIDVNKSNIETIQNQLPAIVNRLSNIEGDFTGINIRLSDLETALNALGDVELVRAQLNQNTTDIAANTAKITANTTDIATNKADIQAHTTTLSALDAKIQTEIDTQVSINASQNTRLNTLESKVVDTAWTNVTPISPFTATKQIQVKRQNGVVYMRGVLAHNTTNNGIGDCFTLPEGFWPPNDGYEYHFLLAGQSTVQTDAAKIYVRPNGLCSIVSKSGTTPIFLDSIMFSIT